MRRETDWLDAPVLDQRNVSHLIDGRRFDFYYAGPNLHMIVLRENHAWVVNTLLDSLSNETMLAIATGLRSLPPPRRVAHRAHPGGRGVARRVRG